MLLDADLIFYWGIFSAQEFLLYSTNGEFVDEFRSNCSTTFDFRLRSICYFSRLSQKIHGTLFQRLSKEWAKHGAVMVLSSVMKKKSFLMCDLSYNYQLVLALEIKL